VACHADCYVGNDWDQYSVSHNEAVVTAEAFCTQCLHIQWPEFIARCYCNLSFVTNGAETKSDVAFLASSLE